MTDRVIVLGEGKVLEIGSPKDLLTGAAGEGHFKALCLVGRVSSTHLLFAYVDCAVQESSDKADLAQALGVDLD